MMSIPDLVDFLIHKATGTYKNDAKQRYEFWASNGKEEHLLGWCNYEMPKQTRIALESRVWQAFLNVKGN